MSNQRYGKFRFSDYIASWNVVAVFLLFSIAGIALDSPLFFIILPAVYAAIRLWAIIAPQYERFILHNDFITVFVGRREQIISLPSRLTLVVSYADICPPLAIRTAVGKQTHILKDKYAVSILHEMPLNVVLEGLHRNNIRRYTSSRIQVVFDDYRYIYSFVCNQTLLDELIANRNCLLVVPESLFGIISINKSTVNVYVDKGY